MLHVNTLMDLAKLESVKSDCCRIKVGSVIADRNSNVLVAAHNFSLFGRDCGHEFREYDTISQSLNHFTIF